MNRDGRVDTGDVADFVLALTDPDAYEHRHGLDPLDVTDINQDGVFDTADVAAFVGLLTASHDHVTDADDMLADHGEHLNVGKGTGDGAADGAGVAGDQGPSILGDGIVRHGNPSLEW